MIILSYPLMQIACDSEMSDLNMNTLAVPDSDIRISADAMLTEESVGDMFVDTTGEPWLKIGTGFRRYESLEDSQDVPIIAGIQGGFHVWGAFLGKGFDDVDIRILYSMELNGEVLAKADYTEFELPKNSKGEFEYAGVAVIYFENDDVERTSGEEFILKLRIETQNGLSLEDQITLRPQCCE